MDSLLESGLVYVAGGAVVVLGIVIGVVTVLRGKGAAAAVPRWAHGAYSIWTGGEDSGTWPPARAQQSLQNWYGATGPGTFWKVIADLRQGTTGNPAWDRVRALDLLRIAHAAQMIDADQCWTETAKIGRELQQRYKSWEELAAGFEAGMHEWQRGRGVTDPQETGRVQRNLPALRSQIWPGVKYETTLPED